MADAGGIAGAIGSIFSAYGAVEQGKQARINAERQRVAADFAARQAERDAGLSIALSQRVALEERRKGDVLASRALAVAAASGGGASDPSVVNILTQTQGTAAYNAAIAHYEGESRARQLRMQAAVSRVTGADAIVAGVNSDISAKLTAAGHLARGFANFEARGGLQGKYGTSGDSGLIQDSFDS